MPVIDRRLVIDDRAAPAAAVGCWPRFASCAAAVRRRARSPGAVEVGASRAKLWGAAGDRFCVALRSRALRAAVLHRGARSRRRRHVSRRDETHSRVDNLGLLEPLGIRVTAPEFPIEPVESDVGKRRRGADRRAVCAAQPGRRMADQAVAARSARGRSRRRSASGTRCSSVVIWGPGEEPLARDVVAASAGAAIAALRARRLPISWRFPAAPSLFVSGDTGPAHIAAAVGTPSSGSTDRRGRRATDRGRRPT